MGSSDEGALKDVSNYSLLLCEFLRVDLVQIYEVCSIDNERGKQSHARLL